MEKYAIVSFIFSDGRSSVGPVITVPPDTVSSFRRAGSRDEYLDVLTLPKKLQGLDAKNFAIN